MSDTTFLSDLRLNFNIKHPDLEECYAYGYDCGTNSVDEGENPFQLDTKESDQWLEGWWDGFYEKEPLLDVAYVEEERDDAANDRHYHDTIDSLLIKLLEISGMIAVSAFVGYQLIELVA